MLGKNALARKLCAILHQVQEQILSIAADHGHIRQVDHQLSSLKLLCGISPDAFHFRSPWDRQFPFENHLPLILGLNDGDLEH